MNSQTGKTAVINMFLFQQQQQQQAYPPAFDQRVKACFDYNHRCFFACHNQREANEMSRLFKLGCLVHNANIPASSTS